MTYEVEQKFHAAGVHGIERAVAELGSSFGDPVAQVDTYLSHPTRDFAETDEALRLRREGGATLITYKGPRVDPLTKTRVEIEVPLAEGDENAARCRELLAALGFAVVADVSKRRRSARVAWRRSAVEICLDDVEGLGTFIELEEVVEEAELSEARRRVASLAEHLGLIRGERASYLELILGGCTPG